MAERLPATRLRRTRIAGVYVPQYVQLLGKMTTHRFSSGRYIKDAYGALSRPKNGTSFSFMA